MARVLVLNPGSNSLKFELIDASEGQTFASEAKKLRACSIEGIGKGEAKLTVFRGHEIDHTEPCAAHDMGECARVAVRWLRGQGEALEDVALIGVRVVHGGPRFTEPTLWSDGVARDIERLEEIAPLHNQSSVDIVAALLQELPDLPIYAAFDTSFHRTLPEVAWRYPIERETADRFGVRKFGFHGFSHRYMVEQYARTVGKPVESLTLVTLHMESGSSAAAIRVGRSVDTTMGMTPLEGLMMGTRSGSVDPAIVGYLARKLDISADDVLTLLNKRSGLLGIAGGTLDTRDLMKRGDAAAALAMSMFAYRVRLAVGAYLAALGEGVEAVLFGGGIGENTPPVRADVCAGLGGWGLRLDDHLNQTSISGQHRLTTDDSRLHAWSMPVEEGLQIAHECLAVRKAKI